MLYGSMTVSEGRPVVSLPRFLSNANLDQQRRPKKSSTMHRKLHQVVMVTPGIFLLWLTADDYLFGRAIDFKETGTVAEQEGQQNAEEP